MAALAALATPGNSGLVWQRVRKHLSNATPAAQWAFKGLREYLVAQGRNPDLSLATFGKAQLITTDDGFGAGAGTAKVYGVYLKKGDDATDAWISLYDNGTDDNIYAGALTASILFQVAMRIALQEHVFISPRGLDIALGIRFASTTTGAAGVTVSVAEADSVDGFVLWGAA